MVGQAFIDKTSEFFINKIFNKFTQKKVRKLIRLSQIIECNFVIQYTKLIKLHQKTITTRSITNYLKECKILHIWCFPNKKAPFLWLSHTRFSFM